MQFNFFEPRYVYMITQALKTNLVFCLDNNFEVDGKKYCDILKILDVKPVQTIDQKVYICEVVNIDRVQMSTIWQ